MRVVCFGGITAVTFPPSLTPPNTSPLPSFPPSRQTPTPPPPSFPLGMGRDGGDEGEEVLGG